MRQTFDIETILPGWAVSKYFFQKGQFKCSLGIDPEMPETDSETKPCGLIRPTAMAKFSADEITGNPVWMESTNKDTNTYVYADDGKVHVVTSALAMGTALNGGAAIANAHGNGLAFYNNYLYIATDQDVARYGPINGAAALTTNFWTGTLTKTALANSTYPSIRGVKIPNHAMFVHPDNARLYFCDVDSNNVGIISMIKTRKVTVEGDTDDNIVPSSYKVLDLNYGWWPTTLCNLGTELAVGLINGTNTDIKQGNSLIAFWSTNPSDTAPSRFAPLPDPLITAMKNVNGQLYVFSGSAQGGCRCSRYLGGESFEEIFYFDDQYPPFQGAVDYLINRIVFGGSTTLPSVSASVFALGSKVRNLSMGVHNILKSTSAGANPLVTAVKYVKNGGVVYPIIGWRDDSAKGLDKISTTYGTNKISWIFNFGKQGNVSKIRIPLTEKVKNNQVLTVNLYIDGSSTAIPCTPTVNYTTSKDALFVEFQPSQVFFNKFELELVLSGTVLMVIALPISIDINWI